MNCVPSEEARGYNSLTENLEANWRPSKRPYNSCRVSVCGSRIEYGKLISFVAAKYELNTVLKPPKM